MPRLFHTPDRFDCADAGTAASTRQAASVRPAHLNMHTPRNLPERRNLAIVIEGDTQSTVAPGMADRSVDIPDAGRDAVSLRRSRYRIGRICASTRARS